VDIKCIEISNFIPMNDTVTEREKIGRQREREKKGPETERKVEKCRKKRPLEKKSEIQSQKLSRK
jgi:hypothetical protein